MDIDFIKWMCFKSENFKIRKYMVNTDVIVEKIEFPEQPYVSHLISPVKCSRMRIAEIERDPVLYKQLIQEAIEGVNRIWMNEIVIHRAVINIFDYDGNLEKEIYFNPLHELLAAKISALQYIFEQETK